MGKSNYKCHLSYILTFKKTFNSYFLTILKLSTVIFPELLCKIPPTTITILANMVIFLICQFINFVAYHYFPIFKNMFKSKFCFSYSNDLRHFISKTFCVNISDDCSF